MKEKLTDVLKIDQDKIQLIYNERQMCKYSSYGFKYNLQPIISWRNRYMQTRAQWFSYNAEGGRNQEASLQLT